MKKIYESYPDLIIISRELLSLNGEDPCMQVRQSCYLPIIVIGGQEYAAETLECGADAYMIKPPSSNELIARVSSLLRRKQNYYPTVDKLNIYLKIIGRGGGGQYGLTDIEFCLASCLIFNRGQLVEYSRLIAEVWGGKQVSLDTLHFYIRSLRNKLSIGNILGIRGLGYCLKDITEIR